VFKREKDNLRMKMKISLKDALVGFTKEIKHLDGHIVTISKKTVTQPGEIIKITGEGMPIHQRGGNGDLLVEMEIEIPQTLTKEQKEKLEVFFRKRSYW
jgi:DnaJ-class molecular chaperone